MNAMTDKLKNKMKSSSFKRPDPKKYGGRLFLIHAMPRTASTSFRLWMNRQPDALCHGEVLGPNKVLGTSHKQKQEFSLIQRNSQPHQFMNSYFADHDLKMVGFKALSSHLIDPKNLAFLRYFFDGKPKVLLLYRNDLVTRYKSTIFHRLRGGKLDEAKILNLKVQDVMANCIQTQVQWEMANQYWMTGLDCHYINIKDANSDMKSNLQTLFGLGMEGELPHTNAKASEQAKDNSRVIEHMERICAASQLDNFRNMSFGKN